MRDSATPDLDVPTALTTIDRAFSYDAPLRRRTEALTWILFGLASTLVATSYVALTSVGIQWDAFYLLWLVGYPSLILGGALVAWRIPGLMHEGLRPEIRRIGIGALALSVILLVQTEIAWRIAPQIGRPWLTVTLSVLLPWSLLAIVQWSRLSVEGRRLSWTIGVVMLVTALVLLLSMGTPAGEGKDALVFAASAGLVPFVAGLVHSLRA